MIKALIFDYFGVVSSDEYWQITGRDIRNGDPNDVYHALSDEVNTGVISWEEFLEKLAQTSGKNIDQIMQMYASHRLDLKLLHSIAQAKSSYKIGLLTNASASYINPIIEQAGLGDLFDSIVVSSEVGVVKPDKAIYHAALKQLGVEPSEAVMIDDQTRNVNGAVHAGMKAVEYKNLEQLKSELGKMDVQL